MFRTRLILGCVIGLSGLLAAGCDDDTTGTDSGMAGMDGGGMSGDDAGPGTDSGGGGDDAGGGGGDDAGGGGADGGDTTDAGGGGDDCATYAADFCGRFMECDPVGFLAAYEEESICLQVVAAQCAGPSSSEIPNSNGLADEDACEAGALADCDSFLNRSLPPLPEACVPEPGEVTEVEGSCFTHLQCGIRTLASGPRRTYCRPLNSGGELVYGTAECPRGQCIAAKSEGSNCNPLNQGTTEFCDFYAGQHCVQGFDSADGADGVNQCRAVTYGTTGDDCFPNTEMQCAPGYECDTQNKTCMAALDEGQACIEDRDLCDRRMNLTCIDSGDGAVCTGPVYVSAGAQCGQVTVDGQTETRLCSAYAYCNEDVSPTVCVARVAPGEVCTVDPDNCWPGYECDSTTNRCEEPEPESGGSCP